MKRQRQPASSLRSKRMFPLRPAVLDKREVGDDYHYHLLDFFVIHALAELVHDHPGLVVVNPLKKVRLALHLHFDVNVLAAFRPDPDVEDAQFAGFGLRLEVRVHVLDFKLVVGQADDGLEEGFENGLVALIAEDEFEEEVVFGQQEFEPALCFDDLHTSTPLCARKLRFRAHSAGVSPPGASRGREKQHPGGAGAAAYPSEHKTGAEAKVDNTVFVEILIHGVISGRGVKRTEADVVTGPGAERQELQDELPAERRL